MSHRHIYFFLSQQIFFVRSDKTLYSEILSSNYFFSVPLSQIIFFLKVQQRNIASPLLKLKVSLADTTSDSSVIYS